jgi:hypothetical protein
MKEIDHAYAERGEEIRTSGVAAASTHWEMRLMRQILHREAENVLAE